MITVGEFVIDENFNITRGSQQVDFKTFFKHFADSKDVRYNVKLEYSLGNSKHQISCNKYVPIASLQSDRGIMDIFICDNIGHIILRRQDNTILRGIAVWM